MQSTRPDFEEDERHLLYREYLRIMADHQPAIFVLENVKGLITSRHGGTKIVSRILDDLSAPGKALNVRGRTGLRYRLYALGSKQSVLPWMEEGQHDGEEFLLQAEEYGIPQMRHRLFIVGVRTDVPGRPEWLEQRPTVPVSAVLADLPPIRSLLSREPDSLEAWRAAISESKGQAWLETTLRSTLGTVARAARGALKEIRSAKLEPGRGAVKYVRAPVAYDDWYRRDSSILTHHESRAHMREDLHRYLFCACFGRVHQQSPKLRDFPAELYPAHLNVSKAVKGDMFDDRFRVQLADRPATTITSHISKDGHYYIHYDPVQCRSLTVREAARLQTFPDSYFFRGTRTEQYHQIGNAVPPLLARDIAGVIFEVLRNWQAE